MLIARLRRRTLHIVVALAGFAGLVPACGDDGSGGPGGSGSAGDASGHAGESGDGATGGASNGGTTGLGGEGGSGGTTTGGDGGAGGTDGNAGESGDGSGGTDNGGSGGVSGSGQSGTAGSGMGGEAGGEAGAAGQGGTGGVDPTCTGTERRTCGVEPGVRGGCFTRVQFCVDGEWGPCRTAPGEMPAGGGEACNGEDDDCDGVADEGLGDFTCGIGACATTVPACVAGVVSACVPRTPTATTDGCNGIDEDCDGAIDENCAACIKVAPDGDDAAAAASNGATPFRNVQPAIDFANTHRSISTRVCVASGAACGVTASFPGPTGVPLTMRNGISVLGKFESTGWTPCSNSVTTLAPQTGDGVLFPASVAGTTVLDGFTIDRFASAVSSGVTVDGGRSVLLSNLGITSAPAVATLYGVNVINGGDATVFRSRIAGRSGTELVVGVRSVGARVSVLDNCTSSLDATGRCPPNSVPSVCAIQAGPGASGRPSYAVLLEDSPGSRIESSGICSLSTVPSAFANPPAAIRVKGASTGVLLRANYVAGSITAQSDDVNHHGIWLEDCGGAKPWIVDNAAIVVSTPNYDAAPAAIRAVGDCHPVIDSNASLGVMSSCQCTSRVVDCVANGGIASRCVVSNNPQIGMGIGLLQQVAGLGPSDTGVGIRCEGGSCAKISRNGIWGSTGRSCRACGYYAYGIDLVGTGTLVERNNIRLGCVNGGMGIRATDSWSRIQNNVVVAFDPLSCDLSVRGVSFRTGLLARVGTSGNELDVHSNYLSGGGSSLTSALPTLGIAIEPAATTQPAIRSGVFRNNLLSGYSQPMGYSFGENSATIDPRILEHNDFLPVDAPGEYPIYFDEGAVELRNVASVNALSDTTVSGNIEELCGEIPLASSPCIDTGTTTGAPLWDIDGRPRDAAPDIGAYELE